MHDILNISNKKTEKLETEQIYCVEYKIKTNLIKRLSQLNLFQVRPLKISYVTAILDGQGCPVVKVICNIFHLCNLNIFCSK
jgi:hypothetical protein